MARVLAAFAALAAFSACAADGPIAHPGVKVGDRWVYQRTDFDAARVLGRYEMEVVFAQRGVIQTVHLQRDGKEVDTTYTSEWNAVTVPGRVFNPHTGWLRFPLQVGDSYKTGFDVVLPEKSRNARNERQVKVVGWEEIEVPAGRFRALKVVSDGAFRADNGVTGSSRNTIWYVPEVRRWAKFTAEIRPSGGAPGEHWGEELVAYKLQ